MNIEPQTSNKLQTLPVMEAFYTLQGEGFHQGKAAYFIRFGGCDVGCFWCDVKESWDESKHTRKTIGQIIEKAKEEINHQWLMINGQWSTEPKPANRKSQTSNICVITGGEPLMHDLAELTAALRQNGFQTHIETSGAYPLSGFWNWICLSPKKFKPPLPEIFHKANELKIVVYNKADIKWAEQNAAKVSSGCQLYLQPEWSKCQVITPLIIDYIKAHPHWQLSLQVHKYINVP